MLHVMKHLPNSHLKFILEVLHFESVLCIWHFQILSLFLRLKQFIQDASTFAFITALMPMPELPNVCFPILNRCTLVSLIERGRQ